MFVTHHLLVVKYISNRTAVMYLGKVVEIAPTESIFLRPVHPYTHALLSGIPIPEVGRKQNRIVLSGDVPSPIHPPLGCRFHTRCPFVIDLCRKEEPLLEEVETGHKGACHRRQEVERLVVERFGQRAISPVS
jgi:oligopeptide/dipeptide ABC transporter ATP-binding protein